MERREGPANADLERPVHGSLQPSAMVVGRVPVADWDVVAAEGDFEIVVIVIADNGAFDLNGVILRMGVQSEFGEVADFLGESRGNVKVELAEIETAVAGGAF